MKREILVATTNPGKIAELKAMLDALGIRVGKKITKISAQWMRGPVLLRQENTQAALGVRNGL